MNDNELLDAMMAAPIPPVATNAVEPILARGQGSQQIPTSQRRAAPQPQAFAAPATNGSSSTATQGQEQVFMDSSYGYTSIWRHEESEKVIPDYRLATSCANCAFSTYDPIQREANCQKWKVCVTPYYVCDSHINPSTLAETPENFSEKSMVNKAADATAETAASVLPAAVNTTTAVTSNYADLELYAEALAITSNYSFDIEGIAKIFSEKKYQQLFKTKYGQAAVAYLS